MASFVAGPSAPSTPSFHKSLHLTYLQSLSKKLSGNSYEGAVTSHLRMSGVYWTLCACSILQRPDEVRELMRGDEIVDWVFQCGGESGGYGGNVGHDEHMLYTLSAVQILALLGRLDDPRFDREKTAGYVIGKVQEDGSVEGDGGGEIDTRFSYCALATMRILGVMDRLPLDKIRSHINACKNFDGGFGCVPGAESHAGQVFCCAASLALLGDDPDPDGLLSWWLSERQCDGGGLNGRPEKQPDVCYSWWILSTLAAAGKTDWIDGGALVDFILRCQDDEKGGIADRPDNVADAFHTFFGIAGLSLLGYMGGVGEKHRGIDPILALPKDVVDKL